MHVGMATGFANHLKVDDAQFVREEMVQCMLAEELGFDSLWLTEHHFDDYSLSPTPMMFLSWLAGRTKHIRLGTQVLVLPWHDPVRVAEEIVMLDHYSGGRGVFGFGRGLARDEYEGFRIDQSKARELFDEIMMLVMNALETGFIEGGEIHKQPRREIRPRPLRPLKGRAFAGGGTPASMISAAKLGLGRLFLNQPMTTSGQRPAFGGGKAQAVPVDPSLGTQDVYEKTWKEAHPNEPIVPPFVSNLVFVDESAERAHELASSYAANTFRAAIKHYEMTSEHHGSVKGYEAYKSLKMTPEEVEDAVEGVVKSSIYGTPRQVLERHEEVKKLRKPQGFFPHLWTGGMPHAEAMRNTHHFAKHCLKELQSWTAEPSTIGEPLSAAA